MATPTIREVVHVGATPATVTTGAGTAVDDILVCFAGSDFYAASGFNAPTGTTGTWTLIDTADIGTNNSHMKAWWRKVTVGGAQTVTVNPITDEENFNATYVLTGADLTTPIDDHVAQSVSTGSTTLNAPGVSPSTSDALCISAVLSQVFALMNYTEPSGFTKQSEDDNSSTQSTASKVLSTSGATGTFAWTGNNSGVTAACITLAVKGASAASVPYNPQRAVQGRDPGEAWWIQRDRRDANTVATAANPLPSPLDSAWQAGARYWHLYGDSADAAPRTWQSLQRNYTSDPNLLAPVTTDPLTLAAGVGGDLWRRYSTPDFADRREVPQQPIRESNPSLLATALLENELLGGADSARHAQAAAFVDRREVPQQRLYVSDPLLLTTAELENELLGGADTAKRANAPATHAPRWWMPQQPRREGSTPGLLDSALLENEFLGSYDDLRRRANLAATHVDRREVAQQPARRTVYFDIGADVPPLTLSWGAGGRHWALYNQTGWQPDRREVPQQRAYISDPSTYPTVPPTDPLTVAWGAGGAYWLLYNTAALQVSRRMVPQQRRYVCDPGLLATALLDELLGSADDLRRRYQQPALLVDRREVPQQRLNPDPSLLLTALLEVPLLGAADTARHTQSAAYTDRREVPQQRAYASDPGLLDTALLEDALLGGADDRRRRYAQAATPADRRSVVGYQPTRPDPSLLGPGPADPLTVAGGVGGDLWRRTNLPAYADRREVPAQPPRSTSYFDAGPDLPPLTLSWGAGGHLWHLYHRAALLRTDWSRQFARQTVAAAPVAVVVRGIPTATSQTGGLVIGSATAAIAVARRSEVAPR